MKKIIIFLSVVCVIVSCFTITTFAQTTVSLPAGDYEWTNDTTWYSDGSFYPTTSPENYVNFTITMSSGFTRLIRYCYVKDGKILFINSDGVTSTTYDIVSKSFSGGSTLSAVKLDSDYYPGEKDSQYFSWLKKLLRSTAPTPTECDGSACPVGDVDLNNICDDCGLPMTMSLRSTLLDYARSVALQGVDTLFPDMEYWLIAHTSNGSDDYYVYCSPTPFYVVDINGPDAANQSLFFRTDSTFQRVRVSTGTDGVHSSHGWATQYLETFDYPPYQTSAGSAMDGFYVDSSHTINFPIPPLWKEIQGVAEGEIQSKTLNSLGGVMTTLTVCGISLVALAVALVLLSKKLRIFLR